MDVCFHGYLGESMIMLAPKTSQGMRNQCALVMIHDFVRANGKNLIILDHIGDVELGYIYTQEDALTFS